MQVWFDDVVIATEYIGPVFGKPKHGKKKATPGKSALLTPGLLIAQPSKTVFSENFEQGPGGFQGGEVTGSGPVSDGAGESRAYAFGPKGASIWDTYSLPVKESTTIRFKLKPLQDVGEATVMIWSKKQSDNCRYRIGPLKKGAWRQIEFRAIEARVGWGMKGPSLEGDVLDNFKLFYEG